MMNILQLLLLLLVTVSAPSVVLGVALGEACTNSNECNTNAEPNAHCPSTNVPRICVCKHGYTKHNGICTLECSDVQPYGAQCEEICLNPPSNTVLCACFPGFKLIGDVFTCIDINECQDANLNSCDHICTNTEGSYTCDCFPGYTSDDGGNTCTDVNECNANNGNCPAGSICVDIPRSFYCVCAGGFTWDSGTNTCTDDDECALGTHHCDQDCVDTQGSYRCECDDEYILAPNGRTCNDINECQDANLNSCDHICTNTEGSYTCDCFPGYTSDDGGNTCTDVNECNANNGNCPAGSICVDIPRSFYCVCDCGFTWDSGTNTCTDINECLVNKGGCQHSCVNEPSGSYTCSCDHGYVLAHNGHSCIAKCTEDEFTCCTSKECIPLSEVCDGANNCADNSDEDQCVNCVPGDWGPWEKVVPVHGIVNCHFERTRAIQTPAGVIGKDCTDLTQSLRCGIYRHCTGGPCTSDDDCDADSLCGLHPSGRVEPLCCPISGFMPFQK